MSDSCHSFLSCDPGQEKWTNEGWGQRSFKMAADGGSVFLGGQPLTRREKKDRGLKMAADGGSVFFGGRPLTRREKKIAGAAKQRRQGGCW